LKQVQVNIGSENVKLSISIENFCPISEYGIASEMSIEHSKNFRIGQILCKIWSKTKSFAIMANGQKLRSGERFMPAQRGAYKYRRGNMTKADKNELLERLANSHVAIRKIVAGRDLEIQVYSDPDWRIRDILGHIATWDREVTKSLRAFAAGGEYYIPDLDEDMFNEQAVLEQRKLSAQQISLEWEQAREDFNKALQAIPDHQFPGELLYPWGDERGDIPELVEFMIEHDDEHREEIENAIRQSADL
jgi:hypothetical protein